MADETTATKTEAQVSAARVQGGLTSGTAESAALVDAATQQIESRTAAARAAILGDKGASITVKFEAEDKALHAKILADAKADDREPNKYLLRWVRQNYKVS